MVCLRYGCGMVVVWFRYACGFGEVMAWFWDDSGMVLMWTRYGYGFGAALVLFW